MKSSERRSANIEEEAAQFCKYLLETRLSGAVTPTKKITAAEMCALQPLHPIFLTKQKIRRLTNFLISTNVPIVTGMDGYCYGLLPEELDETIAMMKDHLKEIASRYRSSLRIRKNMAMRERDLFSQGFGG